MADQGKRDVLLIGATAPPNSVTLRRRQPGFRPISICIQYIYCSSFRSRIAKPHTSQQGQTNQSGREFDCSVFKFVRLKEMFNKMFKLRLLSSFKVSILTLRQLLFSAWRFRLECWPFLLCKIYTLRPNTAGKLKLKATKCIGTDGLIS